MIFVSNTWRKAKRTDPMPELFIKRAFLLLVLIFCFDLSTAQTKPLQKIEQNDLWWEVRLPASRKRIPNYIKISNRASPAVVNIFTTGTHNDYKDPAKTVDEGGILDKFFEPSLNSPQRLSLGSGFIINENGYVMTNAHLVQGSSSISIFQGNDRKEYKASIIGIDSASDIALLKIRSEKKFPFLYLGNSDNVNVGEWIMAVGNPFGFANTVTQGIVSAKGREFDSIRVKRRFGHFIQTDASINPGNSGGPMLNYRGEVIGINTALSTSSLGIGFAIPINTAKTVLLDLKKHGRVIRSYMGIVIQTLTPLLSEGLGLSAKSGSLVVDVVEKSPAFNAGIKVKDVITGFNGHLISNAEDIHDLLESAQPEKPYKVSLNRQGQLLNKTVTLTELKQEIEVTHEKQRSAELDILGLSIEDTLPYSSGVTVNDLDPEGSAAMGGIQHEDIIYEASLKSPKGIKSFKIRNGKDYSHLLKSIEKNSVITFLVNRFGAPVYIAFKLDSK